MRKTVTIFLTAPAGGYEKETAISDFSK